MFGLQRVGDLAWLAGDIRARGFLLGGTAGRTTLNGEGLQHEDGHSHILAGTIPNCVSYDPTFAYEVVTIIRDGMRRMYEEQEDVYYYVTLMNENYPQPGLAEAGEGAEAGILKGLYKLKDGGKTAASGKGKGLRVQLMGSGTILREVMAAAELLKADFGVSADIWSATSYNELRRDGMAAERWNLLHPTEPRRKSWVETCLEGHEGPVIASTDYMRNYADQVREYVQAAGRRYVVLGTDGFGRSDYRAKLRRFFEVDRYYVAVAALKALGRRRRDQAGAGGRGHRQVRAGHRARRAVDGLNARTPEDHNMSQAIDIKVPDIGDFKDVPVIEIFVKRGRHGEGRRPADLARIRQGDHGRAVAPRGRGQVHQRQGRRQAQRRQRVHAVRGRWRCGSHARSIRRSGQA